MENSSRLERLKNRIQKHNRKIFATLALIGLMAGVLFVYFTIQNAKTTDEGEGNLGSSSDLRGFVTNVTVTDRSGNEIPSPYHLGNHYIFNITFAESEIPRHQFEYNDAGVLVYNLPTELKITSPTYNRAIYGVDYAVIGSYSILSDDGGTTWRIEAKFDNVENDGKPTSDGGNLIYHYDNVNFLINIEAEFLGASGGRSVVFGEGVELNFELEQLSANINNTKEGKYNSGNKRATYTSTIVAPATNEVDLTDITFIDTATDHLGNPIPGSKYENIRYRVKPSSTWVAINSAYLTALPDGFSYNFIGLTLAPGQILEVAYEINADYLEATYVGSNGVPPSDGTKSLINDTLFAINNQAWVTALAEETKVEAHSSALVEYSVWIRKESYTNEHASYTTLEDGRIRWELRLWDVPLAGKIITDILGQYPNQKYVGDIEIMVADGHITKIQGGGVQSSYSTSVEFTIPTAGLTDRFVYTFAQTYRSNWYALQGFPDWDEDFIPTYATIVYYTQVDFDNYIQNGYYGNELHIGTIPYLTQKTFIQDPGNDDFSLHKGYEVIEEGGQEYLLYKVKANIGGAWGGTQNIYFIDDLERRVSWYNNEGTKNWGSQEISHSLTKDFQMVIKRADNGAVLVDYSLPDIPVAGTSVWVPTNAKDPLPDGVISRFYLKAYNPNPGKIQIQCQMNAIEGVTTGSMWPFNCDTVVEITYKVPLNAPTVGDPKYISDYYLGRGGTTLKPTLQDVAESWANGEYTDKVYNNMRAYTFTEPKGNLLSSDCYFNRGKKLTKNMIDKGGNIAGFSIVVNQEGKYYAIGVPTYNIVDTMSSNLNILMDTLKIYAISGGKWVDKTDLLNNDPLWAVSFSKLPDSKETEIVFMVPDGVPIKIEYDTYVQGTSGQPSNVYNRVDIAGVSSIEYKDIFLVTQSGASAGGERMQVTTTKYDSELESLLLSGAEFDLYMNAVPTGTPETMMIDGVKFYKIDSDVTDSFGKIVFDNQALTSNIEKIFAIVEVNPPEGYQKDGDGITLFSFNSDEDYNGRPVIWILNNINIGNTASDPEPVPIPQPLRVYKVDVDDDTPLEGAVFELYMALETGEKYEGYDSLSDPPAPVVVGGKVFYYVQTATSTSPDGIALFDSEMIAPEYEAVFLIRETAAPDGYILPESQSERDKFIIIHSLSGEDTDALQFELSREVEFVVDGFFVHNKLEPVIEVHERSLPETGGKGTVLFTLAGILLMLAAIMIVVIRRNRSNGKK